MSKKNRRSKNAIDTSRKKKKVFDVDKNIKVAFKTGQIIHGKNQVLKHLRRDTFKMIILANNCPRDLLSQLNYYNSLRKGKIFLYEYKGSSWDLGLALAKPYMISIMGVIDQGDSDLLTLKNKGN